MGQQCPGDAPDLLPPPPEGGASGCPAGGHRSPAHQSAPSGPTCGSASTSAPTSPWPTRWAARSSTPASRTRTSSTGRRRASRRTAQTVEPYTLEYAERETGVPADAIREAAHAYANADRAMICWTLGHHRAPQRRRQRPRPDHPGAADRARRQVRLRASTRCAARTTSRAAATWAPCPTACRASSTSRTTPCASAASSSGGAWSRPRSGWHLSGMFDAMDRGELTAALRHRREPAAVRGRPSPTERRLRSLDVLIVQDLFLTATAEIADVVFPASAAWAEAEGHRHQLRAAGPARAQGAGAARRGARRPVDHLRAREAPGPRLGRGGRRTGVGRGARRLPGPSRA